MKSDNKSRIFSILAIIQFGEGIMGIFFTDSYLKTWRFGPKSMRNYVDFFINRPIILKIIAAMQIGFGVWLGTKLGHK